MKTYSETYKLLMLFLWKWKLSSTAALAAKFFPHLPPNSAYKKLRYLEVNGLIVTTREIFRDDFIWTLTKKGFESLRRQLPELKESGYKSECLYHDQIVAGVQIGDSLLNPNLPLEFVSEQELRRIIPELLPEWTPSTKLHRPDGYWYKTGDVAGPRVVALEVELSSKDNSSYFSLARHYDRLPQIGRVIWVCENERFANRVFGILKDTCSGAEKTHSFFLVGDIQSFGWGAKVIVGGESGETLRALLCNSTKIEPQEIQRKDLGNLMESFPNKLLFDFHKRRTNFDDYHLALNTQKLP